MTYTFFEMKLAEIIHFKNYIYIIIHLSVRRDPKNYLHLKIFYFS